MWRPTRRAVLRSAAVGLVAASCGDNRESDRFAGFRLGIQSWSFRAFSLADALAMMNRLGLERIELSPGDRPPGHLHFPAPDQEIDALREQVATAGIDCVTAHVLLADDATPELVRDAFAYAKRLHVRTLMIGPPPDQLDLFEQLAIEFDLRAGIHNHAGSRYTQIEHVLAAVDGRDRRLGAIVDTGHYTRVGVDPVVAIEAFADRLYGVHLKDVAAANIAAPDAILGRGVLDVTAVFQALRDVQFPEDASLSLEYETNADAPYDDLAVAVENAARAAHASR